MRKLLLTTAALLALAAVPAKAASQLAVAGGGTFANTSSTSAVVTHGLAVGVAAGSQTSVGTAAGVAVNTPAGSLTAGIGQNQNFGTSNSFTAGALGGSAAAQNVGFNNGAAVGGGFTNVTP